MERKVRLLHLAAVLVVLPLAGCKGTDRVFFATNTSLGVDIDDKPPKVNFGYSRQEVVVAPTFENGAVLPVMSSVDAGGGFFEKILGLYSNHSFSTGEASLVMADAMAEPSPYPFGGSGRVPHPLKPEDQPRGDFSTIGSLPDGSILTKLPADAPCTDPLTGVETPAPMATERVLFYFGTDTTLGFSFKVNKAGATGPVTIGWKRKELSFVPLLDTDASNGLRRVKLASLLATAEGDVAVAMGEGNRKATINQFFATGQAATLLAGHPEIRRVLGQRLVNDQSFASMMTAGDPAAFTWMCVAIGEMREEAAHNPAAAEAVRNLDSLETTVPAQADFTVAAFDPADPNSRLSLNGGSPPVTAGVGGHPATGFQRVVRYRNILRTSVLALDAFLAIPAAQRRWPDQDPGRQALLDAAHAATFDEQDAGQPPRVESYLRQMVEAERAKLVNLHRRLGTDPSVREAVRVYTQIMLTGR